MELRTNLSILFLLCAFGMNAQILINNADLANSATNLTSEILAEDDWTFFADNDHKLLYVDLELLGGFATDLVFENEAGEVVLTEQLIDVPKNAIYEIDLSTLKSGQYSLKVRTYQEVVLKSVEVK